MAAAQVSEPQGITREIKSDNKFKEFIGLLARADAKHDFGHDVGAMHNQINMGLSGITSTATTDERGSLWNVLIDLEGKTDTAKAENIENFFNDVSNDRSNPKVVNIGYRDLANNSGVPIHKYNVHWIAADNSVTGQALRMACGLLTGGILIVDFNQHGFLQMLASDNLQGGASEIYVLTNSSSINDAAPKTKYNDPIFRDGDGAPLISVIDTTEMPSICSTWDNNSVDVNNLFLTSYQIELSPLIIVRNIFGKSIKLTTNITVTNPTGSVKSVIKDTKINNSKVEIMKKITGILSKFLTTKNFEINEGLQRKRSGDWKQVHSCFTLNGKKYSDKNIKNITGVANTKIPTNIKDAYFVTHDLIAAAYALLMGVNVIFLAVASGGRGPRVYIFKNINYETNINEYMHAQLIEKRDTVLARLIEYNTKRTEILSLYSDMITTAIGALQAEIAKSGLKDAEKIKKLCFEILDPVFLYQQIKQTAPDSSYLITELQKGIPANITGDGNLDKVKKMYEIYCIADRIVKSYSRGDILDAQLNIIRSSKVYLTLKNWTYTKEKREPSGSIKRLGIKVGASELPDQDKLAFVAFLETCDNEIKTKIVSIFKLLLGKFEGPAQFIVGRLSGSIYEHALLSFKALCGTICQALANTGTSQDTTSFNRLVNEKDKVYSLTSPRTITEVPNLLSEVSVVEENQEANNKSAILTNSEIVVATPTSPLDELDRTFGSEIELFKAAKESEMNTTQEGGLFNTGTRLLNHNSIKESTHNMLTAHLLLIPTNGVAGAAAIHEYSNEDPDYNLNRLRGGGSRIFSPDLPIYIALEGLRIAVPELNNHIDYEDYITYYLLLESMNDTLKMQSSPLIGFALREILATFISTQVGRDTIAPLFHTLGNEYKLFPLIATSISAYVCGSFVEYDEGNSEVIELAKTVIESNEVKNYINTVIEIYKTKNRNSFYIGEKHNIMLFIDKVNRLQELIGNEIYRNKTGSKSNSSKKMSMRNLKKTIANIHKFMTKRNSRMAVLPNRTYKVAAPLVRAYGGKRRKTLKKR